MKKFLLRQVQITFICQLPGISILKIFTDMLLNTLQYHLMFLPKEHIASSSSRKPLFKICPSVAIMLMWTDLKDWEPYF